MVSLCGKCGCAISYKKKKKRFMLSPDGKLLAKCGTCHAYNQVEMNG